MPIDADGPPTRHDAASVGGEQQAARGGWRRRSGSRPCGRAPRCAERRRSSERLLRLGRGDEPDGDADDQRRARALLAGEAHASRGARSARCRSATIGAVESRPIRWALLHRLDGARGVLRLGVRDHVVVRDEAVDACSRTTASLALRSRRRAIIFTSTSTGQPAAERRDRPRAVASFDDGASSSLQLEVGRRVDDAPDDLPVGLRGRPWGSPTSASMIAKLLILDSAPHGGQSAACRGRRACQVGSWGVSGVVLLRVAAEDVAAEIDEVRRAPRGPSQRGFPPFWTTRLFADERR